MTVGGRFAALTVWFICGMLVLLVITAAGREWARRASLEAEAQQLSEAPFTREGSKPVIVVTGSSTVRLWHSSAATFPEAQVVNTGFGGSTMDSLASHYEGLIGRFEPDQVFIGSGDNDLARGRTQREVLVDTVSILDRIAEQLPGTSVAIIAAKPSVDRWYLRTEYEKLNAGFQELAAHRSDVEFVDVWHPLLDADGQVRPELYGSDGLHLNANGYRIYAAALGAAGDAPALSGRDVRAAERR